MELAAGISAASSALEIAKAMRQIGKDYDAVVIKGQVVDLMDKLLDVKTALQDAKAETEAKDHEIEQLKQAAQVRVKTVERHGMRSGPQTSARANPRVCRFVLVAIRWTVE